MSPAIELREASTCTFRWEVDNFHAHIDEAVAGPLFLSHERKRWRGVWNKGLFLQLLSSVNPVKVQIR